MLKPFDKLPERFSDLSGLMLQMFILAIVGIFGAYIIKWLMRLLILA